MAWQNTIGRTASTAGTGIHRGEHVHLQLRPAPAGTGIVFVRADLGVAIPARAENTRELLNATTLAARGAEVGTVEHIMAAFAGMGVTNAFVDVDGPEIPILDGSALPFVHLIRRAGIVDQGVSVPEIQLLKPLRVGDDTRWVAVQPAPEFAVDYSLNYDTNAIGRQRFTGAMTRTKFVSSIAPARTFGFLHEVAELKKRGLGRGGSLDNCIVVDGERILNGKLRFSDEFARHKVLDLIGDLALLEYPLRAKVTAHRAGHALHVAVVHELLAHPEAWELVEPDRIAPFTVHPYVGEPETQVAFAG